MSGGEWIEAVPESVASLPDGRQQVTVVVPPTWQSLKAGCDSCGYTTIWWRIGQRRAFDSRNNGFRAIQFSYSSTNSMP